MGGQAVRPVRRGKGQRARWNMAEQEALINGVLKNGRSNWRIIQSVRSHLVLLPFEQLVLPVPADGCCCNSPVCPVDYRQPMCPVAHAESALHVHRVASHHVCSAPILSAYGVQENEDVFHPSRTNVDLKDKWRNLCKVARGERSARGRATEALPGALHLLHTNAACNPQCLYIWHSHVRL